jgi:hypothetical protein
VREGTQGRDYKEANERSEVLEGRKWMDGWMMTWMMAWIIEVWGC